MPRIYSANLGGSSGSGGIVVQRAGQDTIAASTQTFTITFSSAVSSANYSIQFSIYNTVDADPIWLQGVVTTKTTTGFTILLNAPTDSANYFIDYMASDYG